MANRTPPKIGRRSRPCVKPGSHSQRQTCAFDTQRLSRLELSRERHELDPAGAAAAAPATGSAADAGGVFREPEGVFPASRARRRARARHARLLPVLAHHRHPPPPVVEHPDRRRRAGIYRPRQGAADRLSGRACDPGADLSRLFPAHCRGGAHQGVRLAAAGRLLLSVRPVRDLSRAPLPPDPHGVARRPLLDERLGLDLCAEGLAVGPAGRDHARPRAAVARGGARALQDAAFLLRRSSRLVRGPRLGVLQARLVALALDAVRSTAQSSPRSPMPRSRRSSGAGGCRASASAKSGWNPPCAAAR